MTSSHGFVEIAFSDGSVLVQRCEDVPSGTFCGWSGAHLSRVAAVHARDAGLLERAGDGISLRAAGGKHPETHFVALVMRRSAFARREAAGRGSDEAPRRSRDVARSRSIISAAIRLLPANAREEALDEWMDEVECAAEAGAGTRARTWSIVSRALPVAIWRAWWPARARQRGG